jgi:hypothetical protein
MLPPQPSRPAQTIAITLSKLLLVEGATPMHFFEALLRHLGLSPKILILDYGGKTDLKPYLRTLTATPNFATVVTSVGVVRDAENDAVAAHQSVTDALTAAGLTPARTPPIQTSIFVLPDNKSPGMIETLCMEAVKNEPSLANSYTCVAEFFACLARNSVPLPSVQSLRRVTPKPIWLRVKRPKCFRAWRPTGVTGLGTMRFSSRSSNSFGRCRCARRPCRDKGCHGVKCIWRQSNTVRQGRRPAPSAGDCPTAGLVND